MNKKNYNLEELGKLFVQIGRIKHGADLAYPFAHGSMIGMLDVCMKYHPERYQEVINENVAKIHKELAAVQASGILKGDE